MLIRTVRWSMWLVILKIRLFPIITFIRPGGTFHLLERLINLWNISWKTKVYRICSIFSLFYSFRKRLKEKNLNIYINMTYSSVLCTPYISTTCFLLGNGETTLTCALFFMRKWKKYIYRGLSWVEAIWISPLNCVCECVGLARCD